MHLCRFALEESRVSNETELKYQNIEGRLNCTVSAGNDVSKASIVQF